jgi:hypothetical protein
MERIEKERKKEKDEKRWKGGRKEMKGSWRIRRKPEMR